MPTTCPICTSTVPSLSKSPPCCNNTNPLRACSECWDIHLSTQISLLPPILLPTAIQCISCPAALSPSSRKRLSTKDTQAQYDLKILRAEEEEIGRKCMARCQGTQTAVQDFHRETDGRVFTCARCGRRECADCDRPEHAGETCGAYRGRVAREHAWAEGEMWRWKKFVACPGCHATCEIEKGCGYAQCAEVWGSPQDHEARTVYGGCGHRFCSHCEVPWVGEGSYCLLGREAHRVDSRGAKKGRMCRYATREDSSVHGVKRRFVLSEEGRRKEDAKKERRKSARDGGKDGEGGVVENSQKKAKVGE